MAITDRRSIAVEESTQPSFTERRHGVTEGQAVKSACLVATTGNVTLAGLQTIDGVTLTEGDRVLVRAQTTGTENGIYVASSGDWTRALDFDGARDVVFGTRIMVVSGSTYALSDWYVTNSDPITIGTTAIVFADLFDIGVTVQAWDADLDAISALSSTGIAARTASNTWALRTITGTANEITLTNGNGVSGNPTVSLPSTLTFTGKTVSGGTFNDGNITTEDNIFTLRNNSDASKHLQFSASAISASTTRTLTAPDASGTIALNAVYDVRTYGATGDGATDDTAAINAALLACRNAGGGRVYIPTGTYKITSALTYDLSAITGQASRVVIEGDGLMKSIISLKGVAAYAFDFEGNSSDVESFMVMRDLQVVSDKTVGAAALRITSAAFTAFYNCYFKAFDYAGDFTDVEQSCWFNCFFRFGNRGLRFGGASLVTDSNNHQFYGCTFSNNSIYGMQVTHANSVTLTGGSVQYNGTIGGGSGQFGIKFIDAGTGYGTVNLYGVVFEGNGGDGDVVSDQTSPLPAVFNFDACSFLRTDSFGGTVGYGTNNIRMLGTSTTARYNIRGCTFRGFSPYAPNASRPYLGIVNTNAIVFDDGASFYESATEAPAWAGSAKMAALGLGGATIGSNALAVTGTTLLNGALTYGGVSLTNAVTGTGKMVLDTSPTLVTPALGTPASGTLTNCTGLPISSGVSGLASGMATFLATPSSSNLKATVTDETGSGALVFATSPTLVTPALGTPSSGTLTSCTGLPVSTGISGLGSGIATWLATPSSANLAAAITDETGTGALVFATDCALAGNPTAPTQTAGNNSTRIATTAFVTSAVAASGVSSFNTRTGAVVPDAGDYTLGPDVNVVINPKMTISQELGTTGATLTNNTDKYIVDQWTMKYNHGAATAVVTSAQITAASFGSALSGFGHGLQLKATTAITSPASGDFARYLTKIEGYRVSGFGYGASGAKTIPVAFELYSTASGTAFVRLSNSAADRFYYHEITVASGWNFYAFTVVGDTSGTWLTDSGVGLKFELFVSGKETTPQSTLDSWTTGNKVQTTNSTNLLGTNNNLTVLTGVYIGLGSLLPTSADLSRLMRPLMDEIILCRRYYEKSFAIETAVAQNVNANPFAFAQIVGGASSQVAANVSFKTTKCSAPSITFYNPFASDAQIYNTISALSWSATAAAQTGVQGFVLTGTGTTGSVAGSTSVVHWSADSRL